MRDRIHQAAATSRFHFALPRNRFSSPGPSQEKIIAASAKFDISTSPRSCHSRLSRTLRLVLIAGEPKVADVYPLFHAEIRQQLQGAACACPAGRTLSSRGG